MQFGIPESHKTRNAILKNQNIEEAIMGAKTYPQIPLRASIFKLTACGGSMLPTENDMIDRGSNHGFR